MKNKALLLLFIPFLFSCAGAPAPIIEDEIHGTPQIAEPPQPVIDYLTIIAAGDNLFHPPILKDFLKNGTYNFDPLYKLVKPYIEPADIAFVNQETVLGNAPYSGYPLFNTPKEAGAALVAAGFDIINQATNHVMDQGVDGILNTLNYWDTIPEVHCLGIHRSEESRSNNFCIVEKNNIRVGFLSYTYGTNYIPLPKDKSYMVSLIETEKMAQEIDAIRPLCDFLAVSMHWGIEYELEASAAQEKLSAFLAEHNVDVIIGHHPHVLQPMVVLPRADGGKTICYYSLGNFASAHVTSDKNLLLGGLMYLRLKKENGTLSLEETGLIPVITHYEKDLTGFKIYPLSEYSDDLAAKHWKRAGDEEMTYEYYYKMTDGLFGTALMLRNPFASIE
ncbi:CapA family protein [Leadbettera azotonutricia]|uniref:Capsule biosynthesis protein CapA n=1 Tax=Leadbettera azotonutricia (strain ATCC BAA-888 / DSM 13862 / ZAS-9) TaxID=545695 RepID=F5YDT4_LEAAZ|nr:CapA family protein [Leadbettera azotonutricia]AEF80267.1 capsule biosynthesis protein CapA [Leadbettera azotonutricia ZAS-9]